MSVSPNYLYIIIEDGEELQLVRSLTPEVDKQRYYGYGSGSRRVRAYVSEKHAKLALKQFGRGKLLRVDLNDGEIV